MTAKAVVMDAQQRRILGSNIALTGWTPRESGEAALHTALEEAGVARAELAMVVATGYGRVALPFADLTVTEITCHARGAHFVLPSVRTVIDVGGQDSKVIAVDAGGYPTDFAMNDRCAAGTGRFFQVTAAALGVDLSELSSLALSASTPASLSSVCTVFAESEIIGLIASGVPREDIAAGLCQAVARRVTALAGQVGVRPDVLMTGGVALNDGVRAALAELLGLPVVCAEGPQLVGALGAALIGCERVTECD